MSRKAYVRPKKRVGEIFRFLHSLISLDHKLKEHQSEKSGNFVLVAPMLRDSVDSVWFPRIGYQDPSHLEHVGLAKSFTVIYDSWLAPCNCQSSSNIICKTVVE